MRNTRLWKMLDSRYGDRIRARLGGGESGAALILTLLFILVVGMTSMLVLGILVAQAVPFVKNSENAQAGYAAETGLQTGLNFLRSADTTKVNSTDDLASTVRSILFPSGTSTGTNTFISGSDSVTAGGTVSGSSITSDSGTVMTSYSNQQSTYSLTIRYYATDPSTDSSPQPISSSSTDITTVKYAVVTSTGTTAGQYSVSRTMQSVFGFTWTVTQGSSGDDGTGDSKVGAETASTAFYAINRGSNNGLVYVDTTSESTMGGKGTLNIATGSGVNDKQIQDPRNAFCLVVKTGTNSDGTVKDAQAGDEILVVRKAYTNPTNPKRIVYSSYCLSNGAYGAVNQWSYGNDNRIQLESTLGTDNPLCITGFSYNDSSNENANATLEKCKGDALSASNQEWYFSSGFLNSRYTSVTQQCVRWTWWGTCSRSVFGYTSATGSSAADFNDTSHLTQRLYAYGLLQYQTSAAAALISSPGLCDLRGGRGSTCYLNATKWENYSDGQNDADDSLKNMVWYAARWNSETYAESLGTSGEDGTKTDQIVGMTGLCANANGGWLGGSTPRILGFPCLVGVASSNSGDNGKMVFSATSGNTGYIKGADYNHCLAVDGSAVAGAKLVDKGSSSSWSGSCTQFTREYVSDAMRTSPLPTGEALEDALAYGFRLRLTRNTDLCATLMFLDNTGHDSNTGSRYIALQQCTGNGSTESGTRSLFGYGELTYPQIWNRFVKTSGDNSGAGSSITPSTGGGYTITRELSASGTGEW